MTKLSVNLNKFALLRNARGTDFPNLIKMARRTIWAGAHGITVHPRPDQRHVKYSDVHELSRLLEEHPTVEFNIEGNPIPRFLDVVREVTPAQCTLVPDAREQLTSDHGWDLREDGERLVPIIRELQAKGVRVSLFMDTELQQIDIAKSISADRIELYTEPYARSFGTNTQQETYDRFRRAAAHAQGIGLGVNAGHDLNLVNLGLFLSIPGILEVSIGHAIVVESFDYGSRERCDAISISSRRSTAAEETCPGLLSTRSRLLSREAMRHVRQPTGNHGADVQPHDREAERQQVRWGSRG